MKSRNYLAMIPVFSLILLIMAIGVTLPEVDADTTTLNRLGKTVVTGQIDSGVVNLSVHRGRNENWPEDGAVQLWLADLSGKRIVWGSITEDAREQGYFNARLPYVTQPGRDALYVVHFRIGSGDEAAVGAFSLAEAVGSLQLQVLGPDTFEAGSRGAVRVVATDRFSGEPFSRADVRVELKGSDKKQVVYNGRTDENGTCNISFEVPENPPVDPALVITAKRRGQLAHIDRAVRINHTAKILLTTDKPLYQPGQMMHIRALALRTANRLPLAKTKALIEVMDAKGNKVFKRKVKTDAYGITSAVFTLANEVNMGNYKIKATIDDFTAEKTVEVKHYVLPKFKVTVKTDRAWYLPGGQISGTINATYIFGKPVKNGEVEIEGLASIVGTETFATLQGRTDADGNFKFDLQLPETLVGRQVDQGLARVQLHATVTGPAGHTQEALRSYPIAKAPLVIRVLPESGMLVPGVKNLIYMMVTSPDGKPVQAKVYAQSGDRIGDDEWWNQNDVSSTDELGLAVFELKVPERNMTLTFGARDDAGNVVASTVKLGVQRKPMSLLLRTDQPTYRLGDVIRVTALTAKAPTKSVFVDLVRNQQTLLTTVAEIKDGVAEVEIPVSEEMVGGVVVTAYSLLPAGNAVRDSRVVYIHPESDLNISIKPEKKIYRPGEDATINFEVTDNNGHPVASALGLTIVDEAVFALQDMQPGLEKVFFTLERELMKPRYEFHSFTPDHIVLDPHDDPVKRRGWTAMLSAVEPALSIPIAERRAADEEQEIRAHIEKQVRRDMKRIGKQLAKADGDLNKVDKKLLLDPWGTPYRVSHWETQVYRMTTAGPDRIWRNADDITVANQTVLKEMEKKRRWKMRRAGNAFGGAGGAMDRMLMDEEAEGAFPPPAAAAQTRSEVTGIDDGIGAAPVRVREYFPETLYVNPALITDGRGKAGITLQMADSITTWRIAAQAVSRDGLLGSATGPVVVFQDFFVDIDFPVALTRNDVVKVPIALYNYLPNKQKVKLKIEQEDWFELVEGDYERNIKLDANEVKAEYIHIKATKVGQHNLTVYAYGSKQSDAIKRSVRVEPDGMLFEQNFSNPLKAEAKHTVLFPAQGIEGANQLFVKVYPGLMSQVVEGLDSIFRMPSGCFEQTSSTTYPNVMVLDYMKATQQVTPEIQMKAEGFINQGYQRLLTFEVNGGGFEWFGRAPAHIILTAYGLMEFYDMSQVYEVDPAVIKRTQKWLADQQQNDGSWKPNQQFLDRVAAAFAKDVQRNTAYVAWALARTGYEGKALDKGISYLEKHHKEAKDAYTLALIANALGYAKPNSPALDQVFKRLDDMRKDEDEVSYWPVEGATAVNSRGKSASIETTALVAQALIKTKRQADVVNRIVTYLIRSKDTFGTYYSTQATVWAMQVMLMVARGGGSEADGDVQVLVNGELAGGFRITPENSDVMRLIDATHLAKVGNNEVTINFAGTGSAMYQVVGRHYIPWKLIKPRPQAEPITIDVQYEKTQLSVNEEVTCTVKVTNNMPGDFGMVVVDIGVPPGFAPDRDSLTKLVDDKKVSKFSTTARQITFYLDELKKGEPLTLVFKLKAVLAMHAVAPQSRIYNYYDPSTEAIAPPIELRVQ